MASCELRTVPRASWAPANPWVWMVPGLGAVTIAFVLAQLLGEGAMPVRFLLLCLGLLAAGVSVWIRLASPQDAFLESFAPPLKRFIYAGLTATGVALVAAPTLLLLRYVGGSVDLPWTLTSLVLLAILSAPWGAWLGLTFGRHWQGFGRASRGEESAAVLTLAAVTAFAASWALYQGPEQATGWDSIRLALSLLALVALLAAPLMVVARGVRRTVLGLLVVLHFGGITTAVLAAPPAPWLIGQLWLWFYRPYLQFMYLNNAYHFYAPEPGPATYLWYRIESVDAARVVHSHWLKIPDMDDNTGKPRYPLALDYQRMLALTENTGGRETTPKIIVQGRDGQQHWAAFYDQRARRAVSGSAALGDVRPEPDLFVPFHPEFLPLDQYHLPNLGAKRYLASFARFVMHQAAARNPALTPVKVKVYRVVHVIELPQPIAQGRDPSYPMLFLPVYMGEYDRDGDMTREGKEDPFLYWLLPILRRDEQPDADIFAYVFKHAGEPGWILDTKQTQLQTKLRLPEDREYRSSAAPGREVMP